eukprot:TRINITY_DN7189_c0_g1_i1.p1 TRINITY_DN7189_c0_g1~~TRINITY_DN7189_c0_g1_i1.p1  ORF type:complete len:404 (+),score=97.01 TRINITY_DN7189_c0_g1_i1:85-1296(+)
MKSLTCGTPPILVLLLASGATGMRLTEEGNKTNDETEDEAIGGCNSIFVKCPAFLQQVGESQELFFRPPVLVDRTAQGLMSGLKGQWVAAEDGAYSGAAGGHVVAHMTSGLSEALHQGLSQEMSGHIVAAMGDVIPFGAFMKPFTAVPMNFLKSQLKGCQSGTTDLMFCPSGPNMLPLLPRSSFQPKRVDLETSRFLDMVTGLITEEAVVEYTKLLLAAQQAWAKAEELKSIKKGGGLLNSAERAKHEEEVVQKAVSELEDFLSKNYRLKGWDGCSRIGNVAVGSYQIPDKDWVKFQRCVRFLCGVPEDALWVEYKLFEEGTRWNPADGPQTRDGKPDDFYELKKFTTSQCPAPKALLQDYEHKAKWLKDQAMQYLQKKKEEAENPGSGDDAYDPYNGFYGGY